MSTGGLRVVLPANYLCSICEKRHPTPIMGHFSPLPSKDAPPADVFHLFNSSLSYSDVLILAMVQNYDEAKEFNIHKAPAIEPSTKSSHSSLHWESLKLSNIPFPPLESLKLLPSWKQLINDNEAESPYHLEMPIALCSTTLYSDSFPVNLFAKNLNYYLSGPLFSSYEAAIDSTCLVQPQALWFFFNLTRCLTVLLALGVSSITVEAKTYPILPPKYSDNTFTERLLYIASKSSHWAHSVLSSYLKDSTLFKQSQTITQTITNILLSAFSKYNGVCDSKSSPSLSKHILGVLRGSHFLEGLQGLVKHIQSKSAFNNLSWIASHAAYYVSARMGKALGLFDTKQSKDLESVANLAQVMSVVLFMGMEVDSEKMVAFSTSRTTLELLSMIDTEARKSIHVSEKMKTWSRRSDFVPPSLLIMSALDLNPSERFLSRYFLSPRAISVFSINDWVYEAAKNIPGFRSCEIVRRYKNSEVKNNSYFNPQYQLEITLESNSPLDIPEGIPLLQYFMEEKVESTLLDEFTKGKMAFEHDIYLKHQMPTADSDDNCVLFESGGNPHTAQSRPPLSICQTSDPSDHIVPDGTGFWISIEVPPDKKGVKSSVAPSTSAKSLFLIPFHVAFQSRLSPIDGHSIDRVKLHKNLNSLSASIPSPQRDVRKCVSPGSEIDSKQTSSPPPIPQNGSNAAAISTPFESNSSLSYALPTPPPLQTSNSSPASSSKIEANVQASKYAVQSQSLPTPLPAATPTFRASSSSPSLHPNPAVRPITSSSPACHQNADFSTKGTYSATTDIAFSEMQANSYSGPQTGLVWTGTAAKYFADQEDVGENSENYDFFYFLPRKIGTAQGSTPPSSLLPVELNKLRSTWRVGPTAPDSGFDFVNRTLTTRLLKPLPEDSVIDTNHGLTRPGDCGCLLFAQSKSDTTIKIPLGFHTMRRRVLGEDFMCSLPMWTAFGYIMEQTTGCSASWFQNNYLTLPNIFEVRV
ncbi:MAG: hypothetical protein Sylvanvirus13_14 [Sylvanvirus sp.]|uniref:Uncharacterized protein n=1 Tax=Sylvanvirus sp. TaxID=2487774 RepID=A0A3G5AI72_9VIRU|nr:MAG: hypothetical protein Sylvanvirus13_14 [Sylvanvirus sp.]